MVQNFKYFLMAIPILAILISLLCAGSYTWGVTNRRTNITIKYENAQQDVYQPLKDAGVELSDDQKHDFENAIKKNHRTLGF